MPAYGGSRGLPLGGGSGIASARFLLAATLVTLVTMGSNAGAVAGELPTSRGDWRERLRSLTATPGYENAHWGLLVQDAASGEVIYERNADQLFCPASVTKLFSGAAALATFGPEHRFRTPLVRRGEITSDGVLNGDLILIAQGDVTLGGRVGPKESFLFANDDHSYADDKLTCGLVKADPLAGLVHLARVLKESGVRSVQGGVWVDDRMFEPAFGSGSGPALVTPIVVNDNLIDLEVSPGPGTGTPAVVRMIPVTSYATMDFQVVTSPVGTPPQIRVEGIGPRSFRVSGRIPEGHAPIVQVFHVREPASFARALLIEALRTQGIEVTASPLAENDRSVLPSSAEVSKLPVVAEYVSPPFKEYLKVILKVSQNLHANTLPMLLASRRGERTMEAGLRRQSEGLKSLGLEAGGFSFGGGSGGTRSDWASPRATVRLLTLLKARPDFPVIQAALPILGRDGTLAGVGTAAKARGHVYAKTGTFSVVNGLNGEKILISKALAGYLETTQGRLLAFAFFVNTVPLRDQPPDGPVSVIGAGRLLGELCELFYEMDTMPETAVKPQTPDR